MFRSNFENATFMFRADILNNTDRIDLVTNNVTELSYLVEVNVQEICLVR